MRIIFRNTLFIVPILVLHFLVISFSTYFFFRFDFQPEKSIDRVHDTSISQARNHILKNPYIHVFLFEPSYYLQWHTNNFERVTHQNWNIIKLKGFSHRGPQVKVFRRKRTIHQRPTKPRTKFQTLGKLCVQRNFPPSALYPKDCVGVEIVAHL